MKKLFEKELYGVKFWWLAIIPIIGLIGVIIGSGNDLAISKVIVNQDDWASRFFEGVGMTPAFVLGTIGGAMLCAGLWQTKKIPARIIGIVMLLAAIGAMGYFNGKYIVDPFAYGPNFTNAFGSKAKLVGMAIGFGLNIIIGCVFFFVFRKKDPVTLIKVGIVVIAITALQAGILEILKRAAYRPRYRWIAGYTYDANGDWVLAPEERLEYYRAWYQGWRWFSKSYYSDAANPLINAASSDYYKSWPSGHTGMVCVMFALPLVVNGFGVKEEKRTTVGAICFVIGALFTVLIAYARIRAGAHYLSDVSTSFFIIGIIVLVLYIVADKLPIHKLPGLKVEQQEQ